ncbi:MAG: glycosidase [Archaeoglobaceae archaeon]
MFKPMCELSTQLCRENRTVDIVKRVCVITANRIHLKKYPIDNPVTVFNPAMLCEDEEAIIFARIVLGYFTYASAVAELFVPMRDIKDNTFSGHYTAEITVLPDNKFDLWGVEDPRVSVVRGKRVMVYCGRTVNYFDPVRRVERTLPVAAIYERSWRKLCVFRLAPELRGFVVSDKDAFIVETKDGLKLFHRLHMRDEKFYMVVSEIPDDVLTYEKFTEVNVSDTALALNPEPFEEKLGWGTPPVEVDGERVVLIHAVDAEMKSYKVFAALINDEGAIEAVTPHYIMAPKESWEVYGDRPFTIFPCGAQLVDDKIYVSYGAADSAIGIGEIDASELLSILDSSRAD